VHAPPLRERGDDIVRLALYYFNQIVSEQLSTAQGFTRHALTAIRTYSWPGNVRELINRVRRAVLLCEGRLIAISDLELPETSPAPVDQLDDARHSAERTAIAQAIQRANGNISRAAKLLGVSRVTLYRLMKKHKLQA
jgi:DNA-binding NtrC family response regulator